MFFTINIYYILENNGNNQGEGGNNYENKMTTKFAMADVIKEFELEIPRNGKWTL